MAQRSGKQVPGGGSGSRPGGSPSGKSSGPRPPVPSGGSSKSGGSSAKSGGGSKSPAKSGNSSKNKNAGRQSVAAARKSSGDRTQLIILSAAVVIIAVIVAVGVVLYKKSTAVQGSGYGVSKSSTASVDDKGTITVSNGSPSLVLDIYEDALCPACGDFEHQYGQQIAKAIDQGQLIVRYHMVNFLESKSASGDYSTRAYGALITVARGAGGEPGQFMAFHSSLFDSANQPKEGGSTDLSNAQLAGLAGKVGVAQSVQDQVSAGTDVAAAKTYAAANITALTALWGGSGYQTPTVARDGKILSVNSVDWLTNLLPAGSQTSSSGSVSGSATGSASGSVSGSGGTSASGSDATGSAPDTASPTTTG